MTKRNRSILVPLSLICLILNGCSSGGADANESVPGSYDELVVFSKEWREFCKPNVIGGIPDYSAEAMAEQEEGLKDFQKRLSAVDYHSWPVSRQVDYHILRAEMNGLEFDHRVLRPWARNPCFYYLIYPGRADVPAREGPEHIGSIHLWEFGMPINEQNLPEFRSRLKAIPGILEQARSNLVEEARDLWYLGIREQEKQGRLLKNLARRLSEHHPDLVQDAEAAGEAVDNFRAWLEEKQKTMTANSGIGIENYNWFMKNVHLLPFTWKEQLDLLEREWNRAMAQLKLEEHKNRDLPPLRFPKNIEEYQKRREDAVTRLLEFIREDEIFTAPDYLDGILSYRPRRLIPSTQLYDFFTQVDYRDSLPLRCHEVHWFELARMEKEPHPSAIRRVPLLFNIWAYRSEGLATGFEELAMNAGLFDDNPRARQLIYVLLACRAARGIADLKMHSNEFTLDEAVDFAVERTPYGWMPREGQTIWLDLRIYLTQPGYGTSYIVGKSHIEKLIAERGARLEEEFSLKRFFDEFFAGGVIPVSLIRWEMTGLEDEINKLW